MEVPVKKVFKSLTCTLGVAMMLVHSGAAAADASREALDNAIAKV